MRRWRGERGLSAEGGGGRHGKPFGFCHGCSKQHFKMLKRDTQNILLSCARSLPGLYLTDLMCAFMRICAVCPILCHF